MTEKNTKATGVDDAPPNVEVGKLVEELADETVLKVPPKPGDRGGLPLSEEVVVKIAAEFGLTPEEVRATYAYDPLAEGAFMSFYPDPAEAKKKVARPLSGHSPRARG